MAGKSLSNPDRTRLMKCSQVYHVTLPETMTTMKKERQKKPPLCPHKKTDFRYEIWLKERKSLREKAKRNSFRVHTADPPPGFPRKGLVTIDTCKAGTNSDVVRLCLQELGWREVSNTVITVETPGTHMLPSKGIMTMWVAFRFDSGKCLYIYRHISNSNFRTFLLFIFPVH